MGADHSYHLRPARPEDHAPIIAVLDDWWGGRRMRDMLPRLFFEHFWTTSFVVASAGPPPEIAGFLIGFISPAHPGEAYIHFVGIHPGHRKAGLGRALYERFFAAARDAGCAVARCVTSPINADSIGFHRRMGFTPKDSAVQRQGTPYFPDYDGPGEDRVLFSIRL